ncbi:MAG TPA: tripartite tricarboxylate transporter substrate-binding protein [Alphaproteobacteria bacterium]|nr:tripartite tricarboxylate transporter substrate-binding protein [Alphaproteobacteria bacterium]
MNPAIRFFVASGLSTAALIGSSATASAQQSVADFYKGKTLTVISTGSVGSIYDLGSRLLVGHMAKHLPGNPETVAQVMTGGGHVVGTNHLYNIAPKDGTTIGAIGEATPLLNVLEPDKVKYDIRKFQWLGNPVLNTLTVVSWHTTGITDIQQVKQKELIIGTGGPASPSTLYPRILNSVGGMKFKIVSGYPGAEIDLAMERGEVNGRGGALWSWWQTSKPHWLAEKKINVLLQVGLRRHPDLPNVPLLTELATNPAEKQIYALFSSTVLVGRPLIAPPGVPADRVAALRAAFDATMKDPTYLAEAKKMNLDIDPVSGVELQQAMEELAATPPDVVELAKIAQTKSAIFNCKEMAKDPKICEQ